MHHHSAPVPLLSPAVGALLRNDIAHPIASGIR
jgi:hypothetical protein